jgi:type I restriction enzyme S subunit
MTPSRVALGDILELERIPIEIDQGAEYRQIGVRSFGNGIFHRELCLGSELSKLRYFEVHPGRLVVSNIMAWEGAIGLTTPGEAGFVGSARFLSYRPIGDVDIRYLNYYFQCTEGRSLIRAASTGTVTRNQTLSLRSFEQIKVPLPESSEQRRIADKLDAALTRERHLHETATSRAGVISSTINAIESRVYERGLASGWKLTRLSDLAEVNPRTKRPMAGEMVAFVPMSALDSATGTIDDETRMDAADVGSGYKLFRRGDVIFARITPCMQNGKSAIFNDEECEHGYGSTEFHVVRPSSELDGRWIHHFLRSYSFRRKAARHMTGTAGQQRLPAAYLRDMEVPLPHTTKEQEIAVRRLDGLQSRRMGFKALQTAQMSHFKAVRQSILEAAFSGQL